MAQPNVTLKVAVVAVAVAAVTAAADLAATRQMSLWMVQAALFNFLFFCLDLFFKFKFPHVRALLEQGL